MQVTTYRATQHLRVEVEAGQSVRATLVALVEEHGAARCTVLATGRIDAVRLAGASGAVSGVVDVIQLTGNADREEMRLALVGRDAKGTLVTGALVDAVAVALELDVELLELVEQRAKPARIPSKSSEAPSWASVAAATAAREQAEADAEPPEGPTPVIGDHIEHPTFGACVVEKIDSDEEFIMVRSAAQRLLRLSLDVLRLELLGEEGGHKKFRARGVRPTARGR